MDSSLQATLAAFARSVDRYVGVSPIKRVLQSIPSVWFPFVGSRVPQEREATDVLVIHSSAYVSPGKRRLIDFLTRRHGLNVREYALGGWRQMVERRHLIAPTYPVVPRFAFKAAIARYLVERYRPKVAVISTEDTIAPFLRFEVNRIGGRLINIAHSVIFPSPLFAMCDYDYYFIYGRASLESLRRNRARFGSARLVLTGSVDLGLHQRLPLEDVANNRATYFSTWLPKNQKDAYLRQFEEIREFAMSCPEWEVLIRLHPLEQPAYWREAAAGARNIRVVDAREPIAESVRRACVTLCPSHSTTALDSACLGRLPLVLDCDEAGARFYDMFPELKRRPGESIAQAIQRIQQNTSAYRHAVENFLNENLAQRVDVPETMSDHIAAVCGGHEILDVVTLDSVLDSRAR